MSDVEFLIGQFRSEIDRYLWLVRKVRQTRVEVETTAQRLELLKKLLTLEGKNVEPLP
jgi:hypothetical protein